MSNKSVFVVDEAFLDNFGNFRNPINTLDHKLNFIYPHFYLANYDLRIIDHKLPKYPKTMDFQEMMELYPEWFYDPYREVTLPNIESLKVVCQNRVIKNVFLGSFTLDHFKYLAPYIKDTTETLYLWKCNSINDLSLLSDFVNLKCVHIYWNNKLETLWNMENNINLKVLSFLFTTNLKNVEALAKSTVEYIMFDGESASTYISNHQFTDLSIFQRIPNLKHLTINYKNLKINDWLAKQT